MAIVQRIASIASILRLLRLTTEMEVIAVARVTDTQWTVCAVLDESDFGLASGEHLDLDSTICNEVRREVKTVTVDDAGIDPVYGQHEFFRRYPFCSYVAEPILLADGSCFGTLCAMGKHPAKVSGEKTRALFRHFAEQIAAEINAQSRVEAVIQELADERQGGALREQFIAVLGHDLRNPMASISTAAHVLKLRRSDPEVVVRLADRIVVTI